MRQFVNVWLTNKQGDKAWAGKPAWAVLMIVSTAMKDTWKNEVQFRKDATLFTFFEQCNRLDYYIDKVSRYPSSLGVPFIMSGRTSMNMSPPERFFWCLNTCSVIYGAENIDKFKLLATLQAL